MLDILTEHRQILNPTRQWQITVHQYSYMVDYHSPTQTEIHVNTHHPTHSDRKHHRGRFMSGSAYRNPPPWIINQQIKTDDLIGRCGSLILNGIDPSSPRPSTHKLTDQWCSTHYWPFPLYLFNGKTQTNTGRWREGEKEKEWREEKIGNKGEEKNGNPPPPKREMREWRGQNEREGRRQRESYRKTK